MELVCGRSGLTSRQASWVFRCRCLPWQRVVFTVKRKIGRVLQWTQWTQHDGNDAGRSNERKEGANWPIIIDDRCLYLGRPIATATYVLFTATTIPPGSIHKIACTICTQSTINQSTRPWRQSQPKRRHLPPKSPSPQTRLPLSAHSHGRTGLSSQQSSAPLSSTSTVAATKLKPSRSLRQPCLMGVLDSLPRQHSRHYVNSVKGVVKFTSKSIASTLFSRRSSFGSSFSIPSLLLCLEAIL